MPQDMQTRLLRVIEEGTVSRIGSTKEIVVDVRIIAATNKDLNEEVKKGNFRKDLFYRLNVLPLMIPPLRDRKDDIPILIDYFMDRISKRLNKRVIPIPDLFMKELLDYDWPGNIRELENLVELMINTESIPLSIKRGKIELHPNAKGDFSLVNYHPCNFAPEDGNLTLEEVERYHIIKTLDKFKGNITMSAKALGIGRNTLYRKIDYYNIDCATIGQCSIMQHENAEVRSEMEHVVFI